MRINSLQYGRAVAAIMVVVAHICVAQNNIIGEINEKVLFFTQFGILGVDFFFVLSGFIITHIYQKGTSFNLSQFIGRRFIRVYVPYIPIGLLYGLYYHYAPDAVGANSDRWNWISTLFLFPDLQNPALNPGWTLEHEILFYLIFASSIFLGKSGILLFIVWQLVCASNIVFCDFSTLGRVFYSINLEFLFGVVVYYIAKHANLNQFRLLFIKSSILILIFIYTVLVIYIPADPFLSFVRIEDYRVIMGGAFALIVLCLVISENSGRIFKNKILLHLGNISYSVYLVHLLVIGVVYRLFRENEIGIFYINLITIIGIYLSSLIYSYVTENKLTHEINIYFNLGGRKKHEEN